MVLSKNSTRQPSGTEMSWYAEATLFKSARQPVLPMPEWVSLSPKQVFVGKRSKDHWCVVSRRACGNAFDVVRRSAIAREERSVDESIS